VIAARRLDLPTSNATEFVDITARLQDEVTAAGLLNGRLHLQSLHTSLGLTMGHVRRRDVFPLPACTVLVESGRLVLGRQQSVFAVELDGPRQRRLALQLDGDFARAPGADAPPTDRDLVELELARQLLVDPTAVQRPMRRLVDAGGKRLRPLLSMLSAKLGPKRDPLRAAALAAAIELIHHATLVHDDYVDEAATRRGRPTVAAKEGALSAVAVGVYYFAKATRVIAELGNPDVTFTIADAVEAVCLSQMDDVRLRGSYPGDRAMYLRVVRGKTAALFAAACRAGAQLGGARPDVVERLARFGDLLGIAFQMADDLLDYSDSSGKPRGQDIRQRVVSLPLIYATEDERLGARVRELLAGPVGEEQVEEVQELVVATGALERVGVEARDLVAAALCELDEAGLDGVRPALADLARSTVDRIT
jgi:heptaprenyl diphosphate synthase